MTRRAVASAGCAVAAAGLVMGLLRDPQVRPQHLVLWAAVAAAVFLADLIVIDFPAAGRAPVPEIVRDGRGYGADSSRALRLEMSAVPVAVGAVFTTPLGLIAAVVIASCLSVMVRRQFEGGVSLVATRAAAAAGATMVVWLLLPGIRPVPGWGLAAVGAGVICYEMVGLAGGLVSVPARQAWALLRPAAAQVGAIVGYNAVLGTLAVLIGLREVWGLLLLAAPMAFFGLWYRSVSLIHQRYENIQRLYGFTAQLADLPDTEAVVGAALALCRQLLACQHAHLVLQGGPSSLRWELPAWDGPARLVESPSSLDPQVLDLDVLGADGPVLLPGSRRHAPVGRPHGRPHGNAMAAPLSLGGSEGGVLVVADHAVPGERFDQGDLQLLEALTSHLGTALTSTRRLEQLQTAAEAREHQALHDALTGLANRTLFSQWVARELARRPEGREVAVLVMDLDGFKDINDSLGHQSGDLVLQEVAARLEGTDGTARMAARLGGDEFAILLTDVADEAEARSAAADIGAAVTRPIALGEMRLEVRASVGIALAPSHGTEPVTLLRRADSAMYAAKAAKRAAVVYDPQMEVGTRRRLTLGSSLRQALDTGCIEVWYQPVARSATGWISSCEALLRWRTEDGFVPPSEFIPIAEQTGLIDPLTWWTLETALEELRFWREEELCPSVAVNLSTRCLQEPDVISRVRNLLLQSDVPPSALTLEITESLLMADPDPAEELLNQLGLMGVRVAIDDFGTGYSSLSRLKRLPVHTIKIDREFVINMHADQGDEAIVKATLELARTLGCVVVAEGVETFEAWHRLQAFGCQQIQGFALARPMPAHECRQWLRSRRNLLEPSSAN